jgi:opacity protein-like surface antigen
MKEVAGKVVFITGGVSGGDVRRLGFARRMAMIAGSAILGMGGGALALADDASSTESVSSRAAEGPPLLFEVAGFGALAVGGRFRLADPSASTGTGSSVSLADHGAFALAVDLRADEGSWYELFYSREATDLRGNAGVPPTGVTVEYLHLGGTLLLDDEPQIKPYLVGGLGIARFTPGEAGNTDTRFSASLGLGLRWPVTKHFSVRLEGRGFVTLVNPDAAVFCRSDQNGLLCRIRGSGQTFIQGEFLAGAAWAF